MRFDYRGGAGHQTHMRWVPARWSGLWLPFKGERRQGRRV